MSNNYNKLYKLIENLKDKINKLDNKTTHINCVKKYVHPKYLTYRICSPCNYDDTKKFIGLLFNSDIDDLKNYELSCNNLSFIKLKKSYCIINYSIHVDVTNYLTINNICSISLGIKDKYSSKIRIIKGSKNIFDLLNNKFTINSTILYNAEDDDELCLIAELNSKIKINSKKSIIKILTL